jgi:type VI secretion system secreted protein VgrG
VAHDYNNFVKLTESPGSTDNYYLFRVDGREFLSTPFEFRLTIRSQGDIPQASTWIGSSISFVMGLSDDVRRYVNGQCVRFEHAYQKGAYVEFVLDITASVAALRLNRTSRIFTNQSAKQIIRQVLQQHSVTFDDSAVRGANSTREYCTQYNESDFDFISRLMEREGVFYYFKYEESAGNFKHKMFLADNPSGFFDGGPLSISLRRDFALRDLQEVETSYSTSSGAWKTNDYNYKTPRSLSPMQTSSQLDYADKSNSVYDWPAGSYDTDGVRLRSRLAMEEIESTAILIEGSGGYVHFTPGARYDIDETNLTIRERRIAIRSVVHAIWDPTGLEEGEPSYQQQFSAVPSQQTYRPPSVTALAVVRGPQTAVVVDQTDSDGYGRVKVRFHWDVDGTSTCWLRVSQQWAGAQIGAQFIPRVGMEVLVDLLEGDPDRPLVVGCLYNGDNKQPFQTPANLSQSGWRTITYPQGQIANIFQFEDKQGGEEIYTYAGRNLRRQTVKDEQVDIGNESTIHVGADQQTDIDGEYKLTVGKDLTVLVNQSTDLTIKKDFKTSVEGDVTAKSDGETSVQAQKNLSLETQKDMTLQSEGGLQIKASGTGEVNTSGELKIESSSTITLTVGGSTISISPSGVKISAPMVELN